MVVFGPVPSRRLGQSLGINNIPAKHCSYACVYCQVGRTTKMEIERRDFYPPSELLRSVEQKLKETEKANVPVDFITFVTDGEPTLDVHLGETLRALKTLGHKIAVISNASLIWREDVREELAQADWVSLKVDAVEESVWRKINRPHGKLSLAAILEGAQAFARSYPNELVTETMLIRDLNDGEANLNRVAEHLATLGPSKAYLSIPTRPPVESWVQPPDAPSLHHAYQIFNTYVEHPEYLIQYEGNDFAATSDVEENLLSILAVHPMREDAVSAFLKKADAPEALAEELVRRGALVKTVHQGQRFFLRRFCPK